MQKLIKPILIFGLFFISGIVAAKIYSNLNKPILIEQEQPMGMITANDILPDLSIFDLDKNLVSFEKKYKNTGKAIIYLYTLDCNSCVTETIDLNSVYNELEDDYKFVGIVYSSDFEKVSSFITNNNISFDHFLIDRKNVNKLKNILWPEVLLVNTNDQSVIQRYSGSGSIDSLKAMTNI